MKFFTALVLLVASFVSVLSKPVADPEPAASPSYGYGGYGSYGGYGGLGLYGLGSYGYGLGGGCGGYGIGIGYGLGTGCRPYGLYGYSSYFPSYYGYGYY